MLSLVLVCVGQLLSVKHEECATTQRRLETANERTKKALSEAEAATAALNAARAEHAEAMRTESSRTTQRHTALQAELEQVTAEVTTLSGQVGLTMLTHLQLRYNSPLIIDLQLCYVAGRGCAG